MSTSFDELDSGKPNGNDKPIWSHDLDNPQAEDQILGWLNTELKALEQESEDRLREIKHNVARYKGIQAYTDAKGANRDRQQERSKYSPKIVVNLLSMITETRVSREMKYKPSIQVIPANDEFDDRTAAKHAKMVIEHVKYTNNFEAMRPQIKRIAEICGEVFVAIGWDADKGDVHPEFDAENPQPLLDDEGQPVMNEDGTPKMIDQPVKIGDVDASIILPHRVFLEKTDAYEKCDYVFIIEPVMTEKLKVDYEDKKEKIKPDSERKHFNLDTLEDEKLVNHTTKITFIHKKTKYMPEGRKIVFTKDAILKSDPHPDEHGDFPFERRVCEIIPGERHGRSLYGNMKGLAAQYNNLTNYIIKYQALFCTPKWFVPKGSVNIESLSNDSTIVTVAGTLGSPVASSVSPTPPEIFTFRENLKEELMGQGRVGDVSRGEPPPGITSGVALQYLGEQELQVTNTEIGQMHDFERRASIKILKVAAQHYAPTDQRTIMVLGESKSWVKQTFKPERLSRAFDVRMAESNALPDSKAQKTQTIIDLQTSFPGMLPPEQVMDMLDLGMPEKFTSAATAAVRAAEFENERLLEINPKDAEKLAPEPYENHIQHWMVHTRQMQDPVFKRLPADIQTAMKDHVMAHEQMMLQKGQENPLFAQALQSLQQFPMLMPMPPMPAMPPVGPDGAPLPVDPNDPNSALAAQGAAPGTDPMAMPPEEMAPQPEPAPTESQPMPQDLGV